MTKEVVQWLVIAILSAAVAEFSQAEPPDESVTVTIIDDEENANSELGALSSAKNTDRDNENAILSAMELSDEENNEEEEEDRRLDCCF